MAESEQPDLTSLVVQLLSAYVSNNIVASEDLPGLIQSTRSALSGDTAPIEPEVPAFVPAVTARKSLGSRDHIISMIDGKPYRTLKRHLATNGLTPNEYRSRYNLPKSYPMIAPGYSDQRREVAQRLGLGRKSTAAATAPAEASDTVSAVASPASQHEASPIKSIATPKAPRKRVAKATIPAPSATVAEQPAETLAPAIEAKAEPSKGRGRAKTPVKADVAVTPVTQVAAVLPELTSTIEAAQADNPAVPVPVPATRGRAKAAAVKSAVTSKAATAKGGKGGRTETAKSPSTPKKRSPAKAKPDTVTESAGE